jgi:BON domain
MKAPAIKMGRPGTTWHRRVCRTAATAPRSAKTARFAYVVMVGVLWMACANAIAGKATAFAQTIAAPSVGSSSATRTPAPIAPATSLPSTISPTITEAPDESAPPRRPHKHKAPHKTPKWVVQSKAQLALQADPRFKNVHASITQPGVIVLEGEVFDEAAKDAARETVAGVQGVKRVINALTTESLKWLLVQNRINQTLQQNGFTLVSVKVIGQTAFLSGRVSSDADNERAVSVVKSSAPDLTIGTNLIEVKSPGL